MTVAELIAELQKLPQDAPAVIERISEMDGEASYWEPTMQMDALNVRPIGSSVLYTRPASLHGTETLVAILR